MYTFASGCSNIHTRGVLPGNLLPLIELCSVFFSGWSELARPYLRPAITPRIRTASSFSGVFFSPLFPPCVSRFLARVRIILFWFYFTLFYFILLCFFSELWLSSPVLLFLLLVIAVFVADAVFFAAGYACSAADAAVLMLLIGLNTICCLCLLRLFRLFRC